MPFAPGYRSRIYKNFGSGFFAQGINAIIRLVSVPVFLRLWGSVQYGEWLILNSIAAFTLLNDCGFSGATANEITVEMARREKRTALDTFLNNFIFTGLLSLVFGTLLFAIFQTPYAGRMLSIFSLPLSLNRQAVVIGVLFLYHSATQRVGLLQDVFRAEGKLALVTMWNTAARVVEAALVLVSVLWHGSLLTAALLMLLTQSIYGIALALGFARVYPFFRPRWSQIRIGKFARRLGMPSLAYFAFPVADRFRNDGIVMILGSLLGPVPTAAFSTARTLTGFSLQIAGAIKHAVWPEMSIALGVGNQALGKALHRQACRASLAVTLPILFFIKWGGPAFFARWTHKQLPLEKGLLDIFLVGVILNLLWNSSTIVSLAINRHGTVAVALVTSSLITLGLATTWAPTLGVTGAALATLVAEAIMLAVVLPYSLEIVGDHWKPFLKGMLTGSAA